MKNMEIKEEVDAYTESVNLHVCNGGSTFTIKQSKWGAVLEISTHSFDVVKNTYEITTDNNAIKALRDLFENASNHHFFIHPVDCAAYVLGKKENVRDEIKYPTPLMDIDSGEQD